MKKMLILFAASVIVTSCNNSSGSKEGDTKSADSAATAPAAEIKDTAAESGLALITKSDCFTCHKLTETSIGPAYALVAAKYQGQQNMIDSLANKVIRGGSGVWGAVPMSPHPMLSKEDAKTMVHYVMTVKN